MTSEQMQELFETSDRVVGEVPLGFHRYLHEAFLLIPLYFVRRSSALRLLPLNLLSDDVPDNGLACPPEYNYHSLPTGSITSAS